MAEYERVPLTVDALFKSDGSFKPRRIIFDGQIFKITKIKDIRPYRPRGICCIAPIEYTVEIDGVEKRIYYEADSNKWFSVKTVK